MKRLSWLFFPALVVILLVVGTRRGEDQKSREAKGEVTPAVESEQINEIRSGDGRMKLTRVSRKRTNGNIEYFFRVIDVVSGAEKTLFEKTVERGKVIEIPLNSWSPDNKQLFIQEGLEKGVEYWVFKANGDSYGDGQKYLNVNDYWARTKYAYSIKEVTGWAGPDLLVVFTQKEDGSNGPAFWFVTGSRKFLQLREI